MKHLISSFNSLHLFVLFYFKIWIAFRIFLLWTRLLVICYLDQENLVRFTAFNLIIFYLLRFSFNNLCYHHEGVLEYFDATYHSPHTSFYNLRWSFSRIIEHPKLSFRLFYHLHWVLMKLFSLKLIFHHDLLAPKMSNLSQRHFRQLSLDRMCYLLFFLTSYSVSIAHVDN